MFKTTEGNAYKSAGDFLLKYLEIRTSASWRLKHQKNVLMFVHIVVFKVTANQRCIFSAFTFLDSLLFIYFQNI